MERQPTMSQNTCISTNEFPPVKTIAVDFDNVIHSMNRGWQSGDIYGNPMRDSRKTVEDLISRGYVVVVFTARDKLNPVREWLKKNNFPEIEVTNKKPPATAYILGNQENYAGSLVRTTEPA